MEVGQRSRPAPFSQYTTPEFWADPHIAARMLEFHLDPLSWPASRPHEFIERSVAWLMQTLGLGPGSRLLDLGCGPGLYANRFAERGVSVLGVDVSPGSLDHARSVAREGRLPAEFRQGNYLEADLGTDHDAATLIYEDYCALSPAQRAELLERVRNALRPGGGFAFDVTASARFDDYADGVVTEPDLMDGFWAEPPYTGTNETWIYPEQRLVLERYTIETAVGSREYWNWMQCLTPADVEAELSAAGFAPPEVFGDIAGAAYDPTGRTFAVLTRHPA